MKAIQNSWRGSAFCTNRMLGMAQSAYTSGKSTITISKYVGASNDASYPNYYINWDHSVNLPETHLNESVFRLTLPAGLGEPILNLDINKLRSHPIIRRLEALNRQEKFATQASRVIIDDRVDASASREILEKNIQEIEKIFQGGFNLPVAFMISAANSHSKAWMQLLSKKRKAIHSNILEGHQAIESGAASSSEKRKPNMLEELVYNEGYKLEHLFLSSFKDGESTARLEDCNGFNFEELLNVLGMINFKGKLVLEEPNFEENALFVENSLRRRGYSQRNRGDFEDQNWFAVI